MHIWTIFNRDAFFFFRSPSGSPSLSSCTCASVTDAGSPLMCHNCDLSIWFSFLWLLQGDKSGDWSKAVCKGCFSGLSPAFSVLFWMFSFKYPSTDSSCYNYIQSWQSLTERWIYNLKPYVVWKKMTSILSLPLLVWRDAFTSGNGEVFNWKETLLTLQLMTIHTKLRSVWSRGWCFLSVQAWSE